MFAGKDFVSESSKLAKITVAKPIYELGVTLTGVGRDKPNTPGLRKLWQQLGQWGWGSINEKYPLTAERAMLTEMIRGAGKRMAPSYHWVDWEAFGRKQSFWLDILLRDLEHSPKDAYASFNGICMSSTRFRHELEPLVKAGFKHYLVACSEQTRRARMTAAGCTYTEAELNDESEQLAKDLYAELPPERIIWNDTEPKPDARFLSVEQFAAMMNA